MKSAVLVLMLRTSANAQICKWKHVRYLPEGSTSWFQAEDRMAGTEVYGDKTDMAAEWSISFENMEYDQLLFTTNNDEHWAILSRTTFPQPAVWNPGTMVPNIRSSMTPNSPG